MYVLETSNFEMNEKDEWVVIKYDIIGCKFSSSEIQNYKDVKGVEPSRAK